MKVILSYCSVFALLILNSSLAFAVDKELDSLYKGVEKRYIEDVKFLVNTDTGGVDESSIKGRQTVAKFLQAKCEKLGATTFTKVEESGVTHLVCDFKGNKPGGKKIALFPHYDTVMRPTDDFKFAYDEKKGIMTGPGVGDSKTSVASMLYVVEIVKNWKSKNMPFDTLRIWFDGSEEGPGRGDIGDKLEQEMIEWADVTLIADSGRPAYGVATKRKGSASCDISVTGIQGHSGNSPQVAASATMELGQVLNKLHQYAQSTDIMRLPKAPGYNSGKGFEDFGPGGAKHDPSKYTPEALKARGVLDTGQYINECSANVGIIGTKNTAKNVIPGDAFANINVRCYSQASYDIFRKDVTAIKATIPGTDVVISCPEKLGPTYDGYDKTAKGNFKIANTEILDAYRDIMKKNFDINVTEWLAGGGTVANYSNKTKPTLDALGVDADPTIEHGPKEYVDIKNVKPRILGLAGLIVEIDKMGTK